MGGDDAPEIVINGAAQSKLRFPNIQFTFVGDKTKIEPLINSFPKLNDSI